MPPIATQFADSTSLTGEVGFALLLSTLAGLATGLGSLLAFLARPTNRTFLGASLGFSGGVMLYVSFVELLPVATEAFEEVLPAEDAELRATLWLFAGVAVALGLDRIVPGPANPHEAALVEDLPEAGATQPGEARHLRRIGVLSAVALAIHNFPEGVATFFTGLADPTQGIAIAVAVALHNVPEGVSVSVPIYSATGSRAKAFWLSFLTGVAEPVGALLAWGLLAGHRSPEWTGAVDAMVAGIMIFIALDQLIPNAKRYGAGHASVYGLVVGMAVMAGTLLLL